MFCSREYILHRTFVTSSSVVAACSGCVHPSYIIHPLIHPSTHQSISTRATKSSRAHHPQLLKWQLLVLVTEARQKAEATQKAMMTTFITKGIVGHSKTNIMLLMALRVDVNAGSCVNVCLFSCFLFGTTF